MINEKIKKGDEAMGIGDWIRRHALLLFAISTIVIIGAGVYYVYWTQQEVKKKEEIKVKRKLWHYNLLAVDHGDEKNIWAVGYRGTILHSEDGGKHWKHQHSNTIATLADVDFINAKEGWAVGQWRTILHTSDGGRHWEKQNPPKDLDPMTYLCSVQFLNEKEGWACGNMAALIHTEDGGKTWKLVDMSKYVEDWGIQFNDVFFLDKNEGWLVGEQGLCFHTTDGGKTWEKVDLGVKKTLFSVTFLTKAKPKKMGFITGADGVLLYTEDGKTWQKPQWKDIPITEHIYNLAFRVSPEWNPATNLGLGVYAVGRGVFIHTYGELQKNWESVIEVKMPENRPLEYTWLRGITWPTDHVGIAVGEDGIILRSWDEGLHWVNIEYGYEYEGE